LFFFCQHRTLGKRCFNVVLTVRAGSVLFIILFVAEEKLNIYLLKL